MKPFHLKLYTRRRGSSAIMALKKTILLTAAACALGQDCSGQGVTWGPGIGPPPAGCGSGGTGPSGGGATCQNPSCSSPPCAAPLLGDVGCTSVAGAETYAHELLSAGDTISSGAHIYGPFEAGFTSQQDNIIRTWGCSTPSATGCIKIWVRLVLLDSTDSCSNN